MNITERIALLAQLGNWILTESDPTLEQAIQQAYRENPWFTPENTRLALNSIASKFLDRESLQAWADHHRLNPLPYPQKNIGIIAAGNIPLVGFHDWLCVFVSGQRALLKCSEKDRVLLPFLINKLADWQFEAREYTYFLQEGEPLKGFDAVIATGSNNSARYFEQYFSKYPHIIRKNRNSVAILTGQESESDLKLLGKDIVSYFGLGCRNVSKLYVPQGYNFDPLLEATHTYNDIINHNKWKNNFDYTVTLYILNKILYLNNGCLILREDKTLTARISCVHYEYYSDLNQLQRELLSIKPEIQCLVGNTPMEGFVSTPFGAAQQPGLADYADGVDTMQFVGDI